MLLLNVLRNRPQAGMREPTSASQYLILILNSLKSGLVLENPSFSSFYYYLQFLFLQLIINLSLFVNIALLSLHAFSCSPWMNTSDLDQDWYCNFFSPPTKIGFPIHYLQLFTAIPLWWRQKLCGFSDKICCCFALTSPRWPCQHGGALLPVQTRTDLRPWSIPYHWGYFCETQRSKQLLHTSCSCVRLSAMPCPLGFPRRSWTHWEWGDIEAFKSSSAVNTSNNNTWMDWRGHCVWVVVLTGCLINSQPVE